MKLVVWLTANEEEVSDSWVNEFEYVPHTLVPSPPTPAPPQIWMLDATCVENELEVEVLVPIIVVVVYCTELCCPGTV